MIYVVIFLAGTALIQFLKNKKRDETLNQLLNYINKGDFEKFDQLIDSNIVKFSFPVYNIFFLKMNAALLKGDKEEIEKSFQPFDRLKMNQAQKEAVYEKAFYYYLGIEDKDRCKEYYDRLMELPNKDKTMISCFYDTYILKGSSYLDQILKLAESADENQKMAYYPLIAEMYHNQKDEKKAKEYEDKVKEMLEKIKESQDV